jgi:hypothetical protein
MGLRFSDQYHMRWFSDLSNACYVLRPSHLRNDIWRGLRITKFCDVQFPPLSCYFRLRTRPQAPSGCVLAFSVTYRASHSFIISGKLIAFYILMLMFLDSRWEHKNSKLNGSKNSAEINFFVNPVLICSQMFSLYHTSSSILTLATFKLWFCPVVWWRDINIDLVLSAFTSSYCMFPFVISGLRLDQELVIRNHFQLKVVSLDPATGAF